MAAKESESEIEISNNEPNPTKTVESLRDLPQELTEKIFMYLSPDDFYHMKKAVPCWLHLINNEYFWKRRCELDHFYPIEETSKSPFYKTFSDNFPYWQATYVYNLVINYNWKNDIFQKIPVANVGQLNEIHHFDDKMLIASDNKGIQIFNSSTGIIEKSFDISCVEAGKILYITKQNNILVCITDLYAIIWNIESECVLTTLKWEKRVVRLRKPCIHQNWVAVNVRYDCGRQEDLFILKIGSKEYYKIRDAVTDVELYNNTAILLQDLSVKVVNLLDQSRKTLTCYSDDHHRVEKISVRNKHVIGLCKSASDVHLSVWNIETFKFVTFTVIDVPYKYPYERKNLALFEIALLDNNKLAYSCCENQNENITVQVINYITGKRIFSINFCNDSSFLSVLPILKAWNNIILSISRSSNDYEVVRMFCPNTGKLMKILKLALNSSVILSPDVIFTPTKFLEFKYNNISETPSHRTTLNILNFEK